MRTTLMIAIPLLWFASLPARADVFKCTTDDGRVEYRDVACAGSARQQVIAIAESPACNDGSAQAAEAARLQYLRAADAALSARLARERELRLQLAADEALAAQQARLAREQDQRQAADYAVPAAGAYWPVMYAYPGRHRAYAARRWRSTAVGQFFQGGAMGRSAGGLGLRANVPPATPMQNFIPR